jgi:hypothetical protein
MSSETFNYDWSRFVKRVNVRASQSLLYMLFATQKGLEKWFLREAVFTAIGDKARDSESEVEVGDMYAWRWHGYDDTVTERGQVTEANGKDKFAFIFGEAGTVTINIYEEQDETIVELAQTEIPTDEKGKAYYHAGCSTGWVFYLANLKSIAEGGADLRNKNVALKDVITA